MAEANIAALGLFREEEHRPFFWPAGQPAALLLHGFMGTPAEMRPLGEAFRQAGWTSQGLLLPGFGHELDTLFERRYQDWIGAALLALDELKRGHRPVLVVGYSLGAAVAINVAAQNPPDGLILAAPFWRIGTPIQRLIWQIVKRVLRRPQPFKRVNFDDPRLRDFFGGLLPELNLDDPATRSSLRQIRVPTSVADQIFRLGKEAGKQANYVATPTLIMQGIDDEAVRSEITRELLQAFPGPIQYMELAADHELIHPENSGYAELSASMLRFASSLSVS